MGLSVECSRDYLLPLKCGESYLFLLSNSEDAYEYEYDTFDPGARTTDRVGASKSIAGLGGEGALFKLLCIYH